MKLFYLILAHDNLSQLDLMLSVLNHPDAYFFIHIDRKVPASEIRKYKFAQAANVKILRHRVYINWGGYSMVEATLKLLKHALSIGLKGYFILLSGKDFPIKSADQIHKYLLDNYGTEFMEFWHLPFTEWPLTGGLDRILYHWHIDELGLAESKKQYFAQRTAKSTRLFFDGFKPFGGSQWFCFTRECVQYIINFLCENDIYESFFRTTYIPDELFFQTLVMNSAFAPKVINNHLRYIVWKDAMHPCILRADDYPSLLTSDCLWARKFDDTTNLIPTFKLESKMYDFRKT